MNAPDTPCIPDVQSGAGYLFIVASGGSDGTLKGGSLGSTSATFKRSSKGNVVIDLLYFPENAGDNCRPAGGGTYGSVTLD